MKHSGICNSCDDLKNCPYDDKLDLDMKELKSIHPHEKDENGNIEWCPMYWNEKIMKNK